MSIIAQDDLQGLYEEYRQVSRELMARWTEVPMHVVLDAAAATVYDRAQERSMDPELLQQWAEVQRG